MLPGFLLSNIRIPGERCVDALRILLSNLRWEKTALIVNYDENGGDNFDHVVPVDTAAGDARRIRRPRHQQVPGSGGIRGPIGLGFASPRMSPTSARPTDGPRLLITRAEASRAVRRRFPISPPGGTRRSAI